MLSREEALGLVHNYLKKKNLVKHVLAVESIMKALAERFGEDPHLWSIAGLLHDLDYEVTFEAPERHGYVTLDYLEGLDVPESVRNAILAHTGHVARTSLLDKAMYCSDPVTGLIVASALLHPTKSLAGVDAGFVGNRFKEKRFAAGANREAIASCRDMGLELHDFLEISIAAMKQIAQELEL
ncbi:MAG: HDIG domain-containing protein [bacterium]|nr:MAG: HDIG domain-containing protein [bacterium]